MKIRSYEHRFRQGFKKIEPDLKKILEQAPQGIGAAKPVRMPSTLTQIHPILPKSNQNLDLEPLNVDLMSDLVNPCAIRAAGGQQ